MRIDLHTHSAVSDGTDSPSDLVLAAARAGLDVVALTDHDTMAGVAEAKAAGQACGVTVLAGLELTCEKDGVTVHLLGYGCRPDDGALGAALQELRSGRDQRVPRIVAALNAAGVGITVGDVMDVAQSGSTLGRPHVADAMVARGFVASRQEAFTDWLAEGRPGYVGHQKVPLEDGLALIRAAGGATVLAHPWGRECRSVLTEDVIRQLAAAGLDGIEVDHQLHDAPTRAALRALAGRCGRCGLIPTGSSDYHGTGKVDHDLGCNLTRDASLKAIMAVISTRGGRC